MAARRPPPAAPTRDRAATRVAWAVLIVSAGALAYQLLLMRWLAIAHWHPFAVMIISLALLGHGASGTWLGLWLDRALRRFETLFPACALLFSLAAVAVLALAGDIPFNGLELVWNPRQLLWLSALYLLLSLPFFFAASCFGLAFARFGEDIPRLYGADLLGAGLGALLAVALLWMPVEQGIAVAAGAGVLAAGFVLPRRAAFAIAWTLAIVLLVHVGATRALRPPVNEFKGLAKALQVGGTRVIAERHGPYGWLAVLESPRVPLRHAPGLSLTNEQEPPPQLALFADGDGMAAITRIDAPDPRPQDTRRDRWRSVAYLQRMSSALPYVIVDAPRVLVLGGGGGQDVLQALASGARSVDVVELDPRRLRLVRDTFGEWAGRLYDDPRVRLHVADARAFARGARERYDVVVLGSGESLAAGGAGVQAASEQYGLTVQALRDYLRLLRPGGVVAITRYGKQPPRDELKLFATAVEALRTRGVRNPARHLAAIRGWDAATLVVGRDPLPPTAVRRIRSFVETRSFDPVHYPGMRRNETNRYNQLDRDWFAEGAAALLSPASQRFQRDYKFAIAPATDDRPYFGDFFRWRSLPELWRLRAQGGAVLLDSGYLLLLGTLAQAVPIALVLVVLPLWWRGENRAIPTMFKVRAGVYFIALGLAFLMIEIATLSRLTLLVGHPLVAVSTGLAGFLVFAGAGSLFAQRLLATPRGAGNPMRPVPRAVAGIALGLAWQWGVFAIAFDAGTEWPVAARASAGLLGIAPLAFAMGLPFPLGLSRLSREAPSLVPWAWGLNGCASVVSAIATLLVAIGIGLGATLLAALGLYGAAALVWWGERPE